MFRRANCTSFRYIRTLNPKPCTLVLEDGFWGVQRAGAFIRSVGLGGVGTPYHNAVSGLGYRVVIPETLGALVGTKCG